MNAAMVEKKRTFDIAFKLKVKLEYASQYSYRAATTSAIAHTGCGQRSLQPSAECNMHANPSYNFHLFVTCRYIANIWRTPPAHFGRKECVEQ